MIEIADKVTILRDGKKIGVYDASKITVENLTERMPFEMFFGSHLFNECRS